MMKDQTSKPSTINARQVYDTFGIARRKLSALVRAGIIRVVELGPVDEEDEELKIYSYEDLWNLTHPEGVENV